MKRSLGYLLVGLLGLGAATTYLGTRTSGCATQPPEQSSPSSPRRSRTQSSGSCQRPVADESALACYDIPQEFSGLAGVVRHLTSEERKKRTLAGLQRLSGLRSLIEQTEQQYCIPQGLLGGLLQQESNLLYDEMNNGDDGGAGVAMFQPGTAREYGLRTFGTSRASGRDVRHGKELRDTVAMLRERLGRDSSAYRSALATLDQRFDPRKAIPAAGHYLHDLYEELGSWNKAVVAYNAGAGGARKRFERFAVEPADLLKTPVRDFDTPGEYPFKHLLFVKGFQHIQKRTQDCRREMFQYTYQISL